MLPGLSSLQFKLDKMFTFLTSKQFFFSFLLDSCIKMPLQIDSPIINRRRINFPNLVNLKAQISYSSIYWYFRYFQWCLRHPQSLYHYNFPTSQLYSDHIWFLKNFDQFLSKKITGTFEQGCQSHFQTILWIYLRSLRCEIKSLVQFYLVNVVYTCTWKRELREN